MKIKTCPVIGWVGARDLIFYESGGRIFPFLPNAGEIVINLPHGIDTIVKLGFQKQINVTWLTNVAVRVIDIVVGNEKRSVPGRWRTVTKVDTLTRGRGGGGTIKIEKNRRIGPIQKEKLSKRSLQSERGTIKIGTIRIY